MRIARELSEITGDSPRLYVITRSAQAVLDGDQINLEQGGLRGLLRVIGTEHPHLWATHIDIDDRTGAERVARQLLVGSDEDETAWRSDEWYAARLSPTALRPDEGRQTLVNHSRDGMRLRLRTPGDMETMEFVAFDRVAPGPGQIEVAVTASSLNFARCVGRVRPVIRLSRGTDPSRAPISSAWSPRSARTSPSTKSGTASGACPPTVVGPRSSPAMPAWPPPCPRV